MNSVGPRTDPCGTPQMTSVRAERLPSRLADVLSSTGEVYLFIPFIAPVTLTLTQWPWHTRLTYIFWRHTFISNGVFRSRISKVKAQTGETDRQTVGQTRPNVHVPQPHSWATMKCQNDEEMHFAVSKMQDQGHQRLHEDLKSGQVRDWQICKIFWTRVTIANSENANYYDER